MVGHKIAVIAGDGIGKEVVPEGIRVLEAAGARHGIAFDWDEKPWSCDYYMRHGRMMPEDGLEQIGGHAAIFLGAVGFPSLVPDHLSLWGLLIRLRRGFEQYANIRPVRLMPGIKSPLADRKPGDIDFIVVRENTEGEYSAIGGRSYEGTEHEVVMQTAVFTRRGVDRIMRYAFELAGTRPARHVTSATKSNGMSIAMPYWDERFAAMASALSGHPGRPVSYRHPDRAFRAESRSLRRRGGLEPVRRHSLRPGPGLHRHHRHRPFGQPQPGSRLSLDVRAGAWLGPRHRRQGHRQSHRPDLVGGDDAGASWAQGCCRIR